MPHVITITGPSGSGKSTTLRNLLESANNSFCPTMVPKYTTRKRHEDDKGEVICVECIPPECDLVYVQYGVLYGLDFRTILNPIANGQSPIVILNDVRAVEDVRNRLGRLVRSVFIFRKKPTIGMFRMLANKKGGINKRETEQRYFKALAIYRIYIENIHLFDHVIVNSGTFDNLKAQARQIVYGLNHDKNWPLRK
jgi:guanylate kinase